MLSCHSSVPVGMGNNFPHYSSTESLLARDANFNASVNILPRGAPNSSKVPISHITHLVRAMRDYCMLWSQQMEVEQNTQSCIKY